MTALDPAPTTDRADGRPVDAPDVLALQRVKPLPHPLRWVAVVVVAVLVAQVVHGLVANPLYQWDRFSYWFFRPVLMRGLVITLKVAAWSAVLGLLGGIGSGRFTCQGRAWGQRWR